MEQLNNEQVSLKQKPGRKSKWATNVENNLERIPKLKRQGYTEEQIAGVLGVGYSTFRDYMKLYPSLQAALKSGKELLVEDLEDTLYMKALGKCKVKKVKTVEVLDLRTGKMKIIRQETQEDEVAPDSGALIFTLKNLASDRWQDRKIVDNNVSNIEQLKVIADTLNAIGLKGIDTSQFKEGDDNEDDDE